MNIRFDFTETGGLPLDQDILNDLQNGTLLTEQIAALFGPLVIISGCVVAGDSVGNGVVAINGEVLPFVGAPLGANVLIVETDTNLAYFDGVARPSQKTRSATFGDDGVQFNAWSSFLRSADGVLADIDALNTDIATIGAEITTIDASITTINTALATCAVKMSTGNAIIGDVPAGGQLYNINFAAALPNTNYIVLLSVLSNGVTAANDVVHQVNVRTKTTAGFTVFISEPSNLTQNISLDYIIIAL